MTKIDIQARRDLVEQLCKANCWYRAEANPEVHEQPSRIDPTLVLRVICSGAESLCPIIARYRTGKGWQWSPGMCEYESPE